jgi:signal peptidase I
MTTSPAATSAQSTLESAPWAEGLKGIIMAFAMALVFRAFIIEGFVIPTGSMAPTLLGQHMRFHSPQSGADWSVGPWYYGPGRVPLPVQGANLRAVDPRTPGATITTQAVRVRDPHTGAEVRAESTPTRGGDRVFILKYVWPFYTPQRYDVVVFRNPRDPTQNYIKRLVGMGEEEFALIDGDVFSRPTSSGAALTEGENTWSLPGWNVARKPERVQRAVWQPIFSSDFSPLNPMRDGRAWFRSPWVAAGESAPSWEIASRRVYRYEGSAPATLAWDVDSRPIFDSYPYNEIPFHRNGVYRVADIRMSLGFEPAQSGAAVAAHIEARGHEFRAQINGTTATLSMRESGQEAWNTLATTNDASALEAGRVTNIDVWHVDQTLWLFVGDKLLLRAEYDWSPDQRLRNALGLTVDEVFSAAENLLLDTARAKPMAARWEFSGGPFSAHRVAMARDIFYQPVSYYPENDATTQFRSTAHSRAGLPGAGTHPQSPVLLGAGEYFFCGDNSPQSLDARLWDVPNPWMARLEPRAGVVSRDALIGRAFVVYWPGTYWRSILPVPDFGRMRQIH